MFNKFSTSINVSYRVTTDFATRHYTETGSRIFNPVSMNIKTDTPEKRVLEIEWGSWSGSYRNSSGNRQIGTVTFKPGQIALFGSAAPGIEIEAIEFDHFLTEDEVIPHLQRMNAEFAVIADQLKTAMTAYEAESKARIEREKADRDARKEAEDRRRIEALSAASKIPWGDNGKAIVDLKEALTAACLMGDSEWAKEVTGINYKKQDGFMYAGDFINSRKIEIEKPAATQVFIVKVKISKRSSRYYVVLLKSDGTLQLVADSGDDSWALELRDVIAALLPKGVEAKTRSISATDDEWEMLKKAAAEKGTSVSALLLDLAAAALPNFPRNQTAWGGGERFEAKAEKLGVNT